MRDQDQSHTPSNPDDAPLIDPRYLSEPADVAKLLRGIEIVRDLVSRRPLSDVISAELVPGPDKKSRSELPYALRQQLETIYHPVSTCRMGVDAQAVVDPELRVRGIRALRVVDASVMPTQVRGNTNAPTLMIAERAVDLIREASMLHAASHTVASATRNGPLSVSVH